MRVLIGDDDRVFAELTATRLRTRGIEVALAFDSPSVMMSAIRKPPDLILLDIHMPGGSGLETLKKLRSSSRTEPIPIIVVSSRTDPSAEEQAVASGARAFLRKPVEAADLMAAIEQAVGPIAGADPSQS